MPIWPAPTTSTFAPSNVPRCSAATVTAADGIDTGMAADAGLGAHPLARLDRVAEQAGELRRGAFAHRGLPRLAHLAEDLALADDHRVEAGGDREQVRDRGVVVVRVEQVGEVFGRGAGVRRRGTRSTSPTAGWKCVQRA